MPDMRRWMQADHNVSETGGREVPLKRRRTSAGVVQNVFFSDVTFNRLWMAFRFHAL